MLGIRVREVARKETRRKPECRETGPSVIPGEPAPRETLLKTAHSGQGRREVAHSALRTELKISGIVLSALRTELKISGIVLSAIQADSELERGHG
jgi:hypothetical protein